MSYIRVYLYISSLVISLRWYMKRFIAIICTCLIFQNLASQKFKYINPNLDDSCVIIKHIQTENPPYEYLLFLDKRDWSKGKEILSDFSYVEFELKNSLPHTYHSILRGREQKLQPINLPRQWVLLHEYKNQQVLYLASEVTPRFILTDSVVSRSEMGDPSIWVIKETEFVEDGCILKIYSDNENSPFNYYELVIQIVDKEKQIAIWELSNEEYTAYWLLVPTETIHYFDIIDNAWYGAIWEISPFDDYQLSK